MKPPRILLIAMAVALAPLSHSDSGLDVHDDYYLGFSQGVYYGLMLAGTDYDTAWCVKGELAYTGRNLGAGAEFQRRIESVLDDCREESAPDE